MNNKLRTTIKILLIPTIILFGLLFVQAFLGLLNAGLSINENPAFALGTSAGAFLIMWLCYYVIKKSIIFIRKKNP